MATYLGAQFSIIVDRGRIVSFAGLTSAPAASNPSEICVD